MDEQAGSPISLLFMLVTMFLFVFLIGILPWRRRKKKKVSLSGQVKFASIWLFILSGLGFIGTATSFQLQGELSLMAVSIFVAAADQFATSLLIIKRSMHALMSLIGAMALSLFSFPFVWFNSYSGNVPIGAAAIIGIPSGIGAIAVNYSPVLRGIVAIRDLKREEKH
jgi:preprotein translocase subunit YajC